MGEGRARCGYRAAVTLARMVHAERNPDSTRECPADGARLFRQRAGLIKDPIPGLVLLHTGFLRNLGPLRDVLRNHRADLGR